ncbi:MAG TPA: hypothetical protein PKO06_06690 [Candidatus Ozemobacteraceae bacterium]|nr:hypothetical protein [Candidatus Ozemobacteraceae bacterium]
MFLRTFLLRWVISIVAAFVLLLVIDPQYFDRPLAEGTAGLAAAEAPSGPFATLIGVDIPDGSQLVSVFLKPRDVSLEARGEFLDPQGEVIMAESFVLASDTAGQKARWTIWKVAPRGAGKYAIRLTQTVPGRITLYFYQGPFWERMLGLPLVLALINLIALFARRSRIEPQSASITPPSDV